MAISNEINEFLKSITQSISKETADILSTVIGKNVVISVNNITELDINEVISSYPPEVVNVKFTISDNPQDMVNVLFEKDVAVKISSWMMMESGEGVEFSEEHLDSIKETANQILGHLSSVLAEEFGKRVDFYSIRAEVLKLEPSLFDFPNPLSTEYSVNMGDEKERKVIMVLSTDVIERFQKGEGESESSGEIATEEIKKDEENIEMLAEEKIEEDSEPEKEESLPMFEKEQEKEDIIMAEVKIPEEISGKMDILMDLSLPIVIELGRTRMLIKDILELGHGSVIEFDKLAGEPVDLLINDKKIAEGEVVVIDEHFGIRLTHLIKPSERIKKLGK